MLYLIQNQVKVRPLTKLIAVGIVPFFPEEDILGARQLVTALNVCLSCRSPSLTVYPDWVMVKE